MKVLVTGGSGLVGRYIVEDLLQAGHAVTIAGRREPAGDLFPKPVGFHAFALGDGTPTDSMFAGVDALVHAAFDHVPGRYRGGEGEDPDGFRTRNLDGTTRLFAAAKRAGVRRAVFLSSRAVYDGLPAGAALTEDTALSPSSLYGQIKLESERALTALGGPGFVPASMRLTGVYGHLRPNKWDGLITDFLAGRPVVARAGSEVHGSDAGAAVRLVLEAGPELVAGRVFNVSDLVVDTHDILSCLKQATGSAHALPDRADKSAVAVMTCEQIHALGWRPGGATLFAETIASLAGHYAD